MILLDQSAAAARTLIDALLEEQRDLTAVDRFARAHGDAGFSTAPFHRSLLPLTRPKPGEQYAFQVDLDRCSGCKSCVTACHALNGLDDDETWRSVGLLHGRGRDSFQQTITTACHHCADPGCLEGCPVLAYDKDPATGIVRHLDDQCIGCQYCILMCPYEVPKYSAQRGIVRKCDMCQQRLEHDEAPACVQACPSEAIRITVVDKEALRAEYRTETVPSAGQSEFLPDSPDPSITLPATRYVSAKPLRPDLIAGDSGQVRVQPAHAPLVVLLVLTQLGAGGFAWLPFMDPAVRPVLALLACSATIAGLAVSVLHLGRPTKAWRAFLGLRRSWLSREIVVFGVFACLSLATTMQYLSHAGAAAPLLRWPTCLVGLLGVFCSGMTYQATGRECWRSELSVGRFFTTTFLLGAATAWWSAALSGAVGSRLAIVLMVATVTKLALELKQLRLCPDDAGLNDELPDTLEARSAFLRRFRFGPLLRARLACAWLGGVVLPGLGLVLASAAPALAAVALLLCLAGETSERLLFFRAVAVRKMPGMPHS